MGKKRGLSVAKRAKIVTLNKEGYSEQQISKKLKFSKTAIHQVIAKFQNFGSFQDLHRSRRSRVTSQKNDHLIKRMQYIHLPYQARKLGRPCCSKAQLPVHHKTLFSR